jgi:hypothetical protein
MEARPLGQELPAPGFGLAPMASVLLTTALVAESSERPDQGDVADEALSADPLRQAQER